MKHLIMNLGAFLFLFTPYCHAVQLMDKSHDFSKIEKLNFDGLEKFVDSLKAKKEDCSIELLTLLQNSQVRVNQEDKSLSVRDKARLTNKRLRHSQACQKADLTHYEETLKK